MKINLEDNLKFNNFLKTAKILILIDCGIINFEVFQNDLYCFY